MNHYRKRYEDEVERFKTYQDYLEEANQRRFESTKKKLTILGIAFVILLFLFYLIWFFFLSEL
tara:strand:+ start:654 stop:842 length:189 start_codon:yes stop_codon:yes gene_type:complete